MTERGKVSRTSDETAGTTSEGDKTNKGDLKHNGRWNTPEGLWLGGFNTGQRQEGLCIRTDTLPCQELKKSYDGGKV